MSPRSPLRVGVLGVGAMGAKHARVYSGMPGVSLVGVVDKDEATSSRVADACLCCAFSSLHELVGHGVEAVSIAVPTSQHAEVALEAISCGIHVLVEKPLAQTVSLAERMIGAANEARVCLMVGHIERFNPAVRKLKACIGEGLIGHVISMSARRMGPYCPRIQDVGVVLDLAIHDINVMTHLCDEPVRRVYSTSGTVVHACQDYATLALTFGNKATGVIEANWLVSQKVRTLMVVGSKAVALVDYIAMTLDIHMDSRHRRVKVEKDEPLRMELEHFVACCENGVSPLIDGQGGAHAVAVGLAAVKSAATFQAVSL
ncbi:MAG: Gfo/Idh/MocA family oxidoreductase [Chloroflexota bacterium]